MEPPIETHFEILNKNLDLNNFIVLYFLYVRKPRKEILFIFQFWLELNWYQSLSLTNYYIYSFGQKLVRFGYMKSRLKNLYSSKAFLRKCIIQILITREDVRCSSQFFIVDFCKKFEAASIEINNHFQGWPTTWIFNQMIALDILLPEFSCLIPHKMRIVGIFC